MYWSPVLPMGTALEGEEGGEFYAEGGGEDFGGAKRVEGGRMRRLFRIRELAHNSLCFLSRWLYFTNKHDNEFVFIFRGAQ